MKCPRCGLVHAASEQVCRRCEVDLRTAEPRPRAVACVAVVESQNPLDRLRAMVPARARKAATPTPASEAATEAAHRPQPAHRTAAESDAHDRAEATRKAASFFRTQKDKVRLPAFLRRKEAVETPPMSCVQCAEPMRVIHDNPYPFWQPLLLWVMGAGLLIAGIFYHLLVITGLLAVVAGVFFHRLGGSHWRCSSCGMIVPRAR
jgi:hypothetical protein